MSKYVVFQYFSVLFYLPVTHIHYTFATETKRDEI